MSSIKKNKSISDSIDRGDKIRTNSKISKNKTVQKILENDMKLKKI